MEYPKTLGPKLHKIITSCQILNPNPQPLNPRRQRKGSLSLSGLCLTTSLVLLRRLLGLPLKLPSSAASNFSSRT